MRPLLFLASYPRSGNTFLRALLANYDSALDRPLTVEEIAHYGMGEKSEPLWRTSTGLSANKRTLQTEWLARARYYDLLRAQPGDGHLLVKTHTFNGEGFKAPAFDIRPGDRAIYIVRHPLDVLISAAHFFDLSLPAMAARLRLPGAFNDTGGAAPFEATGSWSENVIGWMNEKRCPVLFVRYRDLAGDTAGQLKKILQFTGKPVDEDRIARALDFARFERLKQSNDNDGFGQGPARDRRAPFFRVGKTDQWKTELHEEMALEVSQTFATLMDVFDFERPVAPQRDIAPQINVARTAS